MDKKGNKKPLLLTFAIERSHDNEKMLFHYDYSRDMNVLDVNTNIPFIEAGGKKRCEEIRNTIKADREMYPDDEISYSELYTKTDEARETDDEEMCFAELYTKTEQVRESDDDGFMMDPALHSLETLHFKELVSKTFADRERDDEDDGMPKLRYPQNNGNSSLEKWKEISGVARK